MNLGKHQIHNKDGKIMTNSGVLLSLLDPKEEDLRIEDIAIGLARHARFAGQNRFIYTVAQHSIAVASELHLLYGNPTLSLQGLLHDASEAFLGDIPGPVKHVLPDYKDLEEKVQRAIFKRFGLSYPMDPRVKEIDKKRLDEEWQYTVLQDGRTLGIVDYESLNEKEQVDLFISWYSRLKYLINPN